MNNKETTDSGSVSLLTSTLLLLFLCSTANIFCGAKDELPISGAIIASEMDKGLRIVQLESAYQTGVRCGFYAVLNAQSIQNSIDDGTVIFDADEIKARTQSLILDQEAAIQSYEATISDRSKKEGVANVAEATELFEFGTALGLYNEKDRDQTFFIGSINTYRFGGDIFDKSLDFIQKNRGAIHLITHIGNIQNGHFVYIGIINTGSHVPFMLILDSLNNNLLKNTGFRNNLHAIYKQLYPKTPDSTFKTEKSFLSKLFSPKEDISYYEKPAKKEPEYTPSYTSYSSYTPSFNPQRSRVQSNFTPQTLHPLTKKSKTYKIGQNIILKIKHANLLDEKNIDALVNAANTELKHGGGIAFALSQAAGPGMQKESNTIIKKDGPLLVGEAVETGAYNLLKNGIKYIIHTVGPDCRVPNQKAKMASYLRFAYESACEIAQDLKLTSIAFPSISSGIFDCPIQETSFIALKTVIRELFIATQKGYNTLKTVEFILSDESDYIIYVEQMDKIAQNPSLIK